MFKNPFSSKKKEINLIIKVTHAHEVGVIESSAKIFNVNEEVMHLYANENGNVPDPFLTFGDPHYNTVKRDLDLITRKLKIQRLRENIDSKKTSFKITNIFG